MHFSENNLTNPSLLSHFLRARRTFEGCFNAAPSHLIETLFGNYMATFQEHRVVSLAINATSRIRNTSFLAHRTNKDIVIVEIRS